MLPQFISQLGAPGRQKEERRKAARSARVKQPGPRIFTSPLPASAAGAYPLSPAAFEAERRVEIYVGGRITGVDSLGSAKVQEAKVQEHDEVDRDL